MSRDGDVFTQIAKRKGTIDRVPRGETPVVTDDLAAVPVLAEREQERVGNLVLGEVTDAMVERAAAVLAQAHEWHGLRAEDHLDVARAALSAALSPDTPDEQKPTETRRDVIYAAVCAECGNTGDDDGGEHQTTPERAVTVALNCLEFTRDEQGRLLCGDCALADDDDEALSPDTPKGEQR